MEIGQIVYSKSGRDKTLPFIVTFVEEDYVLLVDGCLRKISKPKRKKIKHIQKTNFVNQLIKEKIVNDSYILDADFRKAISDYRDKNVD